MWFFGCGLLSWGCFEVVFSGFWGGCAKRDVLSRITVVNHVKCLGA